MIETNVIQRGFSELLPSEKTAVLSERDEKISNQGKRRMFHERDMGVPDKSCFNIVLTGEYDMTIQSKNTEHFWYIHNLEFPGEDACIIFHIHRASHPYHRHGKTRNLRQAVRKIKGHDVFQMNGRR